MTTTATQLDIDRDKGDFKYEESHKYDAGVGLDESTIDYICDVKGENNWIRDFRKRALKVFEGKPMPTHWATKDLENIDFSSLRPNNVSKTIQFIWMGHHPKCRPETISFRLFCSKFDTTIFLNEFRIHSA